MTSFASHLVAVERQLGAATTAATTTTATATATTTTSATTEEERITTADGTRMWKMVGEACTEAIKRVQTGKYTM